MIQNEFINILNKSSNQIFNNNICEPFQIMNEILSLINTFKSKEITTNNKEIVEKIFVQFKNINEWINLIIENYSQLENSKRKDEQKIRNLYTKYFDMKFQNDTLEYKNKKLIKKEEEFELLKEKTGAIYSNGKIICNERKDNEIIILRTENSLLKNEIKKYEDLLTEKNNIINHLNKQIMNLNMNILNLKKAKEENISSFSNINININESKNNNFKLNNQKSNFINTIEVLPSNKNIKQDYNSNKILSSYKLNQKLINKINKNKKQEEKINLVDKNKNNSISNRYIVVNKTNNRNDIINIKNKKIIQINKIRNSILNNNLTNREHKKFNIEKNNTNYSNKSEKINLNISHTSHKKSNSIHLQNNSFRKIIKHGKNLTLLIENRKYNNIFPGFRLRNKSKGNEQNSKNNNSLPSSIFLNLENSPKTLKNNKNVINDYMLPYTTRRKSNKRNRKIINNYYIKDDSLNLIHNSFLNRTNNKKSIYKTELNF